MDAIFAFLKNFLSNRGVQIINKFVTKGLVAVATYLHVNPDTSGQTALFVSTCAAAVISLALDFISHQIQQNAAKDIATDRAAQAAIDAVKKSGFIILICSILFLSGCSIGEKIGAGIGAAVTSAATHIHPTVTYDPATGTVVGSVEWRRLRGLDKAQCQQCAKDAAKIENDSYKRSKEEMKAVHEREQARIKAEYRACGALVNTSAPTNQSPLEVIETPQIPDANGVTPSTLPESGTMKGGKK